MNPVSRYDSGGSPGAFRAPTLRASCPVCFKASTTQWFLSAVLDSVTTAILIFPSFMGARGLSNQVRIISLPSLVKRKGSGSESI